MTAVRQSGTNALTSDPVVIGASASLSSIRRRRSSLKARQTRSSSVEGLIMSLYYDILWGVSSTKVETLAAWWMRVRSGQYGRGTLVNVRQVKNGDREAQNTIFGPLAKPGGFTLV